MQTFLDLEIHQKLEDYLAGKLSLDQFQEWFAPVVWAVDESGNPAAVALAYELELRLSEYSHGHWTEDELRDFFRSLALNQEVVAPGVPRSDVHIGPAEAVDIPVVRLRLTVPTEARDREDLVRG